MPLCVKCRKFFPPDVIFVIDEKMNEYECVWCKRGVKEIQYTEKDGSVRKYTREDCVRDYKVLLGKLAEKKNVKSILEAEKDGRQ